MSSPAKSKRRASASASASPVKRVKAAKRGAVSSEPDPSTEAGPSTPTIPRSPSLGEVGESNHEEVKEYDCVPDCSPSLGSSRGDGMSLRSNSPRSVDEQPTQEDFEFEAFDDDPIEQGTVRSEVTLLSHSPSPGPSGPITYSQRLRRVAGRSRLVVCDDDDEDDWMHGPTSVPAVRGEWRATTPSCSAQATEPLAGEEMGVSNNEQGNVVSSIIPSAYTGARVRRSDGSFFGSGTPVPLSEVIADITAEHTAAAERVEADPQVGRLSPPLYRRLGFL